MDDHVTFDQPITFNTLTHVTSLENTHNILQENFNMQVVGDYSCVNKLIDSNGRHHPLCFTPFFWMAPDNHGTTTAIRYGNVAFSLKNLEILKQFNFYYVEFLDYVTKTAARIMLTRKNYDQQLKRFEPFNEVMEGKIPVLFKNGEWMCYKCLSNVTNDSIPLDIEFLLDDLPQQNNVYCKYVKCFDPRPIITTHGWKCGAVSVYNGNLDIFRLISLFTRYQGLNCYEFRSPTFMGEIILIIQAVPCTNDFVADGNIGCFTDCNHNCEKPDHVLCKMDLGKAFDMQEIQPMDWASVQKLDFLYQHSGTLPNTQTLLNVLVKGVAAMKSEKTVGEVLSIFFQCFISSGAKQSVKKYLLNVLCSL